MGDLSGELHFQMTTYFSIVISFIALAISATTAWLTLFRRGSLRITQPTIIFLGPDDGRPTPRNKVYLRTLLYSTSRRGQTIESLHVNVQRGESKQNFSVWVYGEDKLARGSGLHVGFEGVTCNHHFLLPKGCGDFSLSAGEYILRIYAKLVMAAAPKELAKITLIISESQARELSSKDAGIFFDWGPDQQRYEANVDRRVTSEMGI